MAKVDKKFLNQLLDSAIVGSVVIMFTFSLFNSIVFVYYQESYLWLLLVTLKQLLYVSSTITCWIILMVILKKLDKI